MAGFAGAPKIGQLKAEVSQLESKKEEMASAKEQIGNALKELGEKRGDIKANLTMLHKKLGELSNTLQSEQLPENVRSQIIKQKEQIIEQISMLKNALSNIQGQISSLREQMGFIKESFGNIKTGIDVRQKVLGAVAGKAANQLSQQKEGGKVKG